MRGSGAAIFATAGVRTQSPARLPGLALHSRVVHVLALMLAVVVLLSGLLTLAVQTIVRGRIPTAISYQGMTWSDEATAATRDAIARLQAQLDGLTAALHKKATREIVR